jgi:hypothetical protein
MSKPLDELVQEWTLSGFSKKPEEEGFGQLLRYLEYLSDKFYSRYVPALYPPSRPVFLDRLFVWLTNPGVHKRDSQLMFKLAARLNFFSFEDFIELYRAAFTGPITRWLIDQEGLKIGDVDFQSKLDSALRTKTWFCPITDSMIIGEFYHANKVTGIDQRPAFRAMSEFGNPQVLRDYMTRKGLTRIVLMEDFVGTGTQCISHIKWALAELKMPLLFIPMVVCPRGASALSSITDPNFHWEHLVLIDDSACATRRNTDPFLRLVTDLAVKLHKLVAPTSGSTDLSYGPLGFGCTGSVTVLFSNTPDNTLPLIHYRSQSWSPLFPRVSREV